MKTLCALPTVAFIVVASCTRSGVPPVAGCAKDSDCNADRLCVSGQCVAPPQTAEAAAPTNDGADPRLPVLSPDDAAFVDTRAGWGWSDRAWGELHAAKYGWALAACQKGLAVPNLDAHARAALLYNEGLAYEGGHDPADARPLFEQSLGARTAGDPGRLEVQRALARVGGPPAPLPAPPATCNEAHWGQQAGCAASEKCLCDHIGGPITPVNCWCGVPPARGTCGNNGESCSSSQGCCKVPAGSARYHCMTPSDDLLCEGGIN